ncbi:hypothetical protein [Acuticoccus sediminis]|uniref:hypothetical protein n=1 Tax=Acuticoccus sediminis TaxID=2184697 RepID=UPI001CFC60D8|nr:hypothetical protein [Acuticoccus sediminis]
MKGLDRIEIAGFGEYRLEMSSEINIGLSIDQRKIVYRIEVTGPVREAFHIDKNPTWFGDVNGHDPTFFVEYDEDVSAVPPSIAIIPALANIMPIAWVYGARVTVPDVDAAFLQSLEGVRRGYTGMYHPDLKFDGELVPGKVTTNPLPQRGGSPLVFYSGGVDATFSVISKIGKSPHLFTIWGSDVFFKQAEKWAAMDRSHRTFADRNRLAYSTAKTTFRSFLDYRSLSAIARDAGGTSWWHGFQHGIGLLGHAAPVAWLHGIQRVVIGSTHSVFSPPDTKCASWPTIDGFLRYSDTVIEHHDFYAMRQDKVHAICRRSKRRGIDVELRVCWQSRDFGNCCTCEKCARTLLAIEAEGFEPSEFGFNLTDEKALVIADKLRSGKIRPTIHWRPIIRLLEDRPVDASAKPHVAALLESVRSLRTIPEAPGSLQPGGLSVRPTDPVETLHAAE